MNNAFTSYVSRRILSVVAGQPGGAPVRVDFASGYVVSFNDSFATKYEETEGMGSPDTIKHYSSTPRSMSITIQLVAESYAFARSNMTNISKLAQLTYPTYTNQYGSRTIKTIPKVKVKMMNFICDHRMKGYLPGYITNLTYDFDLQDGVFEVSKEEIYPKYIKVSFTFLPEHVKIGYSDTSGQKGEADSDGGFQHFPYGIGASVSLKKKGADMPENQPDVNKDPPTAGTESKTPEQKEKEAQSRNLATEEQHGQALTPAGEKTQYLWDRAVNAAKALFGD